MVARLAYLQAIRPGYYETMGVAQRNRTVTLAANRGSIVDRNDLIFAMSAEQRTVWADPTQVSDPGLQGQALADILKRDAPEVTKLLKSTGHFVYLARKVDNDAADAIQRLIDTKKFKGVFLLVEPKRFSPADDLAASIIGNVDVDNKGISGLELQYQATLNGVPGREVIEKDRNGNTISSADRTGTPAVQGQGLRLSLDRSLQYEIDKIVSAQVDRNHARHATAIVMNRRTGEIVALSNIDRGAQKPPVAPPVVAAATTGVSVPATATTVAPAVDPAADPAATTTVPAATTTVAPVAPTLPPIEYEPAHPSIVNYAATDVFEPGSMNKLIALSAALEERLVTPATQIDVPEEIAFNDKVFKDHIAGAPKPMTVAEIISQSSNLGTIRIAEQLGAPRLDTYLRRFGFAAATELGFPGESRGLLLDIKRWSESDIGSVPLGQGLSVTALQMLAAYNTIANSGVYVPPRLVLSTIDDHGVHHDVPATAGHRVVSTETANEVTQILQGVVTGLNGTGNLAAVEGYTVAGKTGTAKVPLPGGTGYEDHGYITGFAGFVPAINPEYTILITFDHPELVFLPHSDQLLPGVNGQPADPTGGNTSAPVFADIAKVVLRTYQVPPSGRAS